LVLFPLLSFEGLVFATWSTSLLAQNDRVIELVVNGLLAKNTFLKDLQHGSNALANLTTFGGFVLRHGKAEKAA